jgi:endonuclease III
MGNRPQNSGMGNRPQNHSDRLLHNQFKHTMNKDLKIFPITNTVLEELGKALSTIQDGDKALERYSSTNITSVKDYAVSYFGCSLEGRGWTFLDGNDEPLYGEDRTNKFKNALDSYIKWQERSESTPKQSSCSSMNKMGDSQDVENERPTNDSKKRSRGKKSVRLEVIKHYEREHRDKMESKQRRLANTDGSGHDVFQLAVVKGKAPVYVKKDFVFSIGDRSSVYTHDRALEPKMKLNCRQKQGLASGGNHNWWTPAFKKGRLETYGDETFNKTPRMAESELDPSSWTKAMLEDYKADVKYGKHNKASFMNMFDMLTRLETCLSGDEGVESIRSRWLEVFTYECEQVQLGKYSGCGKCKGCINRFCQATIVIKCASGVSDVSVLMTLGSVFRSKQFRSYCLEDWVALKPWELAVVLNSTSCAAKNALFLLPLLERVMKQGFLPTTVAEITVFYGMKLKSAALIINAVYGTNAAIAVDRHLCRIFQGLGWCNSFTQDETKIALKIMGWFPNTLWGRVNDLFAGLSQLLVVSKAVADREDKDDIYKYRALILEKARLVDRRCKKASHSAEELVQKLIDCLPEKEKTTSTQN